MDPVQYCRDKVAPPGSSLHYSLLFLPEAERRAALGLFCWQRQVMDISRRSQECAPRQAQLDWWRQELERLYAGLPGHHASLLLAEALPGHNLQQDLFREILEASAMDAEGGPYPDYQALSLYCHRRGAALWLLAAELFGYRERQTVRYAHELGTALELARIILELGADCARGQLYLPLDELEAHGVEPETLLAGRRPARFAELMRVQLERVRRHFAEAEHHLAQQDRAAQHPGLVLAALVQARLAAAARRDFPMLAEAVELPPLLELWTAWRTARRAKR